MYCYKDMTFCTFYEECKGGLSCRRALTARVRLEANGIPVCVYTEKPECYKEKK